MPQDSPELVHALQERIKELGCLYEISNIAATSTDPLDEKLQLAITGFPSVSGAVEAIKSGAMDYLAKPFTAKELKASVEKTLQQRYGRTAVSAETVEGHPESFNYHGIIGSSAPARELVDLIERVKETRVSTFGQPRPGIAPAAMQVLKEHSWPGNIRELENIIQRMLILCDGQIEADHLPDYLRQLAEQGVSSEDGKLLSLKEVEQRHIRKVLKATDGNKTKAAEIPGINRKTLRLKLRKDGE